MMYPMINEGAHILEEGIAARPSDIDVIWLYGYGWPIYRGGPMFWADTVGLKHIADRLSYLRQGDQRSLAGAVAAAQAPRRRGRDVCLARRAVEGGLMFSKGMLLPRAQSHLSHRERSDRVGDPGEGFRSLDRPYPLTPALSPRERGRTEF